MKTFSGYLSVYNDWEILPNVLASIKNLVSELIVVDGGYTWMKSYLEATGKEPDRSYPILYSILNESGIPYRTINNVWSNEIEKRIAGYNECGTDYVYRIDADEITFISDENLHSFMKGDSVVSEMDLPMYDSPGYVQWPQKLEQFPRQGFLFDRIKISAEDHLRYLWLVLTADTLKNSHVSLRPAYTKPVAFNAHLSQWRTSQGGLQRAAFYTLNYMRKHGAPHRAQIHKGPISDFKEFFHQLPPAIFESAMKRSRVINSQYLLDRGSLSSSSLKSSDEEKFSYIYDRFTKSMTSMNKNEAVSQGFIAGTDICIHADYDNLGSEWELCLEFDCPVESAAVTVHTVSKHEPYMTSFNVDVNLNNKKLELKIPEIEGKNDLLRQILTISINPVAPYWFGHFNICKFGN